MKKILLLIGILIVIGVVGLIHEKSSVTTEPSPLSYKNTTYTLEGMPVTLVDGVSEIEAAHGSASKIITTYFGNEAHGDLNNDGKEDTAFILTQQTGGSGTFYYAVAALKTDAGYIGTNGIFLGDRIAPQTTEIESGHLVVNYAERKPTDPMTAPPSIGVSKYFKIENNTLIDTTNSYVLPQRPPPINPTVSTKESCQKNKGTWSDQYKECLGVTEGVCTSIGGTWNGCASACRHDPTAQMCTQNCVLVCTIQ